jgi:hypothetical protein
LVTAELPPPLPSPPIAPDEVFAVAPLPPEPTTTDMVDDKAADINI